MKQKRRFSAINWTGYKAFMTKWIVLLPVWIGSISVFAQDNEVTLPLAQMFTEGKLKVENYKVKKGLEGDREFLSIGDGQAEEPIWLPISNFENGKIELVAKGKDILQGSFYGLVFHAENNSTFDVVYCRPFNFRADDPVRKIHAIQYSSNPDFDWPYLRENFNGIYEMGIDNPPAAEDWVTLTIEIQGDSIQAFINHSQVPALSVKKLNNRTQGRIGIRVANSDLELVRIWRKDDGL